MSSEIKVSSVKAKDGTAGISIADSTGDIGFSGNTLKNAVLDSTVTGVGISDISTFFITGNAANSGAHTYTSTWAIQNSAPFATKGAAVTEASGIFTFPSTGYWLITAQLRGYLDGASNSTVMYVEVSTDNGSNYTTRGEAQVNAYTSSAYINLRTSIIIDVTSITGGTTFKVRLSKAGAGTFTQLGSSTTNSSSMIFQRLGST